MSWESIIGFIIIAAISSIFKGKNQTTHRRTSDPSRPTDPTSMEAPTKVPPKPAASRTTTHRPVPQRTNTSKSLASKPANSTNRPKTSGGLEEMIRELQRNMGEVFNQSMAREVEEVVPKDTTGEKETAVDYRNPREVVKEKQVVINPITEKEIGKESIGNIKFNRQSILQGIIMSEVLEKPKSLRR